MPTTDEAMKFGLGLVPSPAFASVPFFKRSAQDFRGAFAGGGETGVGVKFADFGPDGAGAATAPAVVLGTASGDLFERDVDVEMGEEGDGVCVWVDVAVVGAEVGGVLEVGNFEVAASATTACCLSGEGAFDLRARAGRVQSTCAASSTTLGGGFAFGLIVKPNRVEVSGRKADIRKSNPGLGPVCAGSEVSEEGGVFDR